MRRPLIHPPSPIPHPLWFLACCLALAISASAQDRYPVDWQKLQPEVVDRFTELLRIDTTNPPGNETKAVNAIRAIFEREGIASRTFALDPSRANLVARIKGSGARRPILLMGHTDVVGVQREKWTVDPFAAVQKNGTIYARGASDDKPHVVAGMMILLLLKRLNVKLDRDVIFLAEAGEEGTSTVGIDYMIREHWPEIECEYALAEGGAIVAEGGRPRYLLVSSTEKNPQRIRLVAHGEAGHASRPTMDNAVVHLAAAVEKAGTWQTPVRFNETTRGYFSGLASLVAPELGERYRAVLDPKRAAEIDRYFRWMASVQGSDGTWNRRCPVLSSARNISVSRREGGENGRELDFGGMISIAGSLITRRSSARNFVMSSLGSARTSSVASASDGITFDRKPALMIVGTTLVRSSE